MERTAHLSRRGPNRRTHFWGAAWNWVKPRDRRPAITHPDALACVGTPLEIGPPRRNAGNPFTDCLQARDGDLDGLHDSSLPYLATAITLPLTLTRFLGCSASGPS